MENNTPFTLENAQAMIALLAQSLFSYVYRSTNTPEPTPCFPAESSKYTNLCGNQADLEAWANHTIQGSAGRVRYQRNGTLAPKFWLDEASMLTELNRTGGDSFYAIEWKLVPVRVVQVTPKPPKRGV